MYHIPYTGEKCEGLRVDVGFDSNYYGHTYTGDSTSTYPEEGIHINFYTYILYNAIFYRQFEALYASKVPYRCFCTRF